PDAGALNRLGKLLFTSGDRIVLQSADDFRGVAERALADGWPMLSPTVPAAIRMLCSRNSDDSGICDAVGRIVGSLEAKQVLRLTCRFSTRENPLQEALLLADPLRFHLESLLSLHRLIRRKACCFRSCLGTGDQILVMTTDAAAAVEECGGG